MNIILNSETAYIIGKYYLPIMYAGHFFFNKYTENTVDDAYKFTAISIRFWVNSNTFINRSKSGSNKRSNY
jgi:hypothetical protein